MKYFLICPVRGHDPKEFQDVYDKEIAKGNTVYWPPIHTNQDDPTGYRICIDNRKAMRKADAILFIWDGKSTGSLFDLGMAFQMEKPIIVVSMPPATEGKSFQNMVAEWSEDSIPFLKRKNRTDELSK